MTLDNFNLSDREKKILTSYIENDSFPHTLLIDGANIEGRTEFAKFVANAILCQSTGTDKPCGKCSACIKCAADSNPDLKQFGEEKESYTFKVETSREIRKDAFVIPNDSDRKVYIIKEAQNMNDASENALLKILEEPPHFDYFVMTCSSKNAMLDTVLSRSAVISMGDAEESFSPEALQLSDSIMSALCENNELKIVEALSPLASEKQLFEECMSCLGAMFTEALKYKKTQMCSKEFESEAHSICAKLSQTKIYSVINMLSALKEKFKQNANYNLLLTNTAVALKGAVNG